jgi:hypothetical protein
MPSTGGNTLPKMKKILFRKTFVGSRSGIKVFCVHQTVTMRGRDRFLFVCRRQL